MIDFERAKRKIRETTTAKQRARSLLDGLVGEERTTFLTEGLERTLPKPGEAPASYLARSLRSIGSEASSLHRDPQQECSTKGITVDIRNRIVGFSPHPEMSMLSVVTCYGDKGSIAGYVLTFEAGQNTRTILTDGEGNIDSRELERPLNHLEAVNHAGRLFEGVIQVEAMVGVLMPSTSPHGGQPLPLPIGHVA